MSSFIDDVVRKNVFYHALFYIVVVFVVALFSSGVMYGGYDGYGHPIMVVLAIGTLLFTVLPVTIARWILIRNVLDFFAMRKLLVTAVALVEFFVMFLSVSSIGSIIIGDALGFLILLVFNFLNIVFFVFIIFVNFLVKLMR